MSSLDSAAAEIPVEEIGLLQMPAEVILELCKTFLPAGNLPLSTYREYEYALESFSALARLARTCSAIHEIVAPLLDEYKGKPLRPELIPWARSMMQCGETCQYETSFNMVPSDNNGLFIDSDCLRWDTFASNYSFSTPSTLRQHFIQTTDALHETTLFHGMRSMIPFLILPRLPNLKSITFYLTFVEAIHTQNPRGPIIQHNFTRSWDSLKYAKLIGFQPVDIRNDLLTWDGDPASINLGCDLSYYSWFLNHSTNLEVLEIERIVTCDVGLKMPSLVSMRLIHCSLTAFTMTTLMESSLDRLESFVYRTGFYHDYLQLKNVNRLWDEIYPAQIIDSIKQIAQLQTLEIDIRGRGSLSRRNAKDDGCDDPRWHFIYTLTIIKTLRHVSLTQQTLWEPYFNRSPGFENDGTNTGKRRLIYLLPTSIESFTLSDVTAEFLPAIITLAEHVETKMFKNLKQVRFHPSPDLVRQITHAKAHEDDPDIPRHRVIQGSVYFCGVDPSILRRIKRAVTIFKRANVEVDFSSEVYPFITDNKDDLQRQRDLCHWCSRCHWDEVGCLEKQDSSEEVRNCPYGEFC
ncbi:hypothetical protein F4804DRAFT_328187 [Jackrogersella minutella]|nr:hypothetical protein F4804DRAFT_328187 [Jackrogersella minutella]